ncbi:adenylosuccinate synthase [Neglectibacter timonensis]|uniref:adenylosuccinate synthase n=1 Tax=Neglectibacter timonensis TaxID=1776382 RepID=UPI00248EA2A8|nr:adenylosuccinate synthase [Neglectibacter timonensis]
MVKAIVGACWGDEGKGKITDVLAENSDLVVRFQGGSNAGHTIINEYGKFALHQLPSGVFRQNIINVIGNGVALSVENFTNELSTLLERGVPRPRLLVSDRCQVVMPYHKEQDGLEEARLAAKSFGSTKSGIAPFSSDKYAKIGFQVSDLFDAKDALMERIDHVTGLKNVLYTELYHREPLDRNEIYAKLMEYREQLAPYVTDTATLLYDAVRKGKTILLEGQLGSLKDPDLGIYPMVTSSSPLAGYGAVGAGGIPPYAIQQIITVVKAYSSAVGAGEFVSEIFGEEAEELRKRGGDGGEYGATTGRPRRMGWLDLVAARYGCMVQGATDVAFTVLDALGYLDEIPVCVAYELDGKRIDTFPPTAQLKRCKPILEVLPGWKCDIGGIKNYEELPADAKNYVEFAEKHLGVPITIVSNGPAREDIIYRK